MSPTSKKQEETSTKFAKKSEADRKKYSTNISERILGKKLHGQQPKRISKADVDQEKTNQW